jgi:DNA-binding NarL/FixJ family response regulator
MPLRVSVEDLVRRARLDVPGIKRLADRDLGLTERETEVLRLVAEGRTNREIAGELYISTKTASVHVSNILRKVGATTRGEAAAIAHRNRLAPSS